MNTYQKPRDGQILAALLMREVGRHWFESGICMPREKSHYRSFLYPDTGHRGGRQKEVEECTHVRQAE